MTELRTRRTKAHYGDKDVIKGKPAMRVKSGKKADYVTPAEFLEDMYGVQIESIHLADGRVLSKDKE